MWNFLRNIIDQWTDSDKAFGAIGAIGGYFTSVIFINIGTTAESIIHILVAVVTAVITAMAAVLGKHFGEKIIKLKIFKNGKEKRSDKRAA